MERDEALAGERAGHLPSRAELIGLYRGVPRRELAQVWARWWTCPLGEVLADAPEEGRILEVGCGRGITVMHLALGHPNREVVGLDIDATKVAVAEVAASALGPDDARVVLEVRPSGDLPGGLFDAIVFNDMLYLLSADDRRALLEESVAHLAPGGVILVKEDDTTPRWKHVVNVAHNAVLRRVLHNLAGETVDLWPSSEYVALFESMGLSALVQPLGRGYPYAHYLLLARSMA